MLLVSASATAVLLWAPAGGSAGPCRCLSILPKPLWAALAHVALTRHGDELWCALAAAEDVVVVRVPLSAPRGEGGAVQTQCKLTGHTAVVRRSPPGCDTVCRRTSRRRPQVSATCWWRGTLSGQSRVSGSVPLLLSASEDRTYKVWDVELPAFVHCPPRAGRARGLCIPKSKLVLCGGRL